MRTKSESSSTERCSLEGLAGIVTERRYSDEANKLAAKVAQATRMRHAKWLVSRQFVLDQSNVDTSLTEQARYCESVIHDERERVTRNQRLLLQCERERVKDKLSQQEARQRIHAGVVDAILAETRAR